MPHVFEIRDQFGRTVYLSRERWSHINQEHPEVAPFLEHIKQALESPDSFNKSNFDENVIYYYNYFKSKDNGAKYLLVIVKYLNAHGFIITAYFVKHIT